MRWMTRTEASKNLNKWSGVFVPPDLFVVFALVYLLRAYLVVLSLLALKGLGSAEAKG